MNPTGKQTTKKSNKRATSKKTTTRAKSAAKKTVTARKTTERACPDRHPTEDQIRQRAYEIYLARNRQPGDAYADWMRAKSELHAELTR